MTAMQIAGRELAFNKQGHLAYFEDWNPSVAEALAEQEALELTDCHWAVIRFLRDYYALHDMPPSPKVIIKAVGDQVASQVPCRRKHLESLFPGGGCKQACRIAGLPRHYCHSC